MNHNELKKKIKQIEIVDNGDYRYFSCPVCCFENKIKEVDDKNREYEEVVKESLKDRYELCNCNTIFKLDYRTYPEIKVSIKDLIMEDAFDYFELLSHLKEIIEIMKESVETLEFYHSHIQEHCNQDILKKNSFSKNMQESGIFQEFIRENIEALQDFEDLKFKIGKFIYMLRKYRI